MPRTHFAASPAIADRIAALRRSKWAQLDIPSLSSPEGPGKAFLGIGSFAKHMSSEGWQLQDGLSQAGYRLFGRGLPNNQVDVPTILEGNALDTVILQDRREWHSKNPASIAKGEDFLRHEELGKRSNVLKLTVLKDAHHDVGDGSETAKVCGLHGWVVYYHPAVIKTLAGYVRPDCLIRTYHSVDANLIPKFATRAERCLLSGAQAESVYPLRTRLFREKPAGVTLMSHPGYHANGTNTNEYLKQLSRYRVAICTCSIFGYALRKIIEATACGCRVITDLPPDEVLPEIDGNLIRVSPNIPTTTMAALVDELSRSWDYVVQKEYAKRACEFYDYRATTRRLASDIEAFRLRLLGS